MANNLGSDLGSQMKNLKNGMTPTSRTGRIVMYVVLAIVFIIILIIIISLSLKAKKNKDNNEIVLIGSPMILTLWVTHTPPSYVPQR